MSSETTHPQTTVETPSAPAAEPWPRPDFERQVQRLRAELEDAARREKQIAQNIAAVQDRAFRGGLPVSVLLGGKDEAKKLGEEQDAAQVATQRARDALRTFIDDERNRFSVAREESRRRLHPETSAQFERTKLLVKELDEIVSHRLGALEEIEAGERAARVWNKMAERINRSIPQENINAIPSVAPIVDSLRGAIEGLLIGNPTLRKFFQGILERDNEKRQRAEEHRELLEREAKSGTIFDPSFDHIV